MAIDKFSVAPGSLPILRQNITSTGSFVVPAGVTYMYILAAGGGGNASGGGSTSYGGFLTGNAGGGSGGTAQGWVRTVPGDTLAITIGAAGGATNINSTGDFPFSFTGNGGGSGSTDQGGSQSNGTAGTTSIVAQALQFINAGLGTLPTTTIGIGTAPHYSAAGGAGTGLAGSGAQGNGNGGTGLSGTPSFPGGSGISAKSEGINGGVGGGGGGGTRPDTGSPQGLGGQGAVRIYY